jgi:hypothetical protein
MGKLHTVRARGGDPIETGTRVHVELRPRRNDLSGRPVDELGTDEPRGARFSDRINTRDGLICPWRPQTYYKSLNLSRPRTGSPGRPRSTAEFAPPAPRCGRSPLDAAVREAARGEAGAQPAPSVGAERFKPSITSS